MLVILPLSDFFDFFNQKPTLKQINKTKTKKILGVKVPVL